MDFATDEYEPRPLDCPEAEETLRYGGRQNEDEDEEDKRRAAERERKKAEVRKRLEEAGRMKKAKKGFLTPERKKKLRKLLMLKAAEDLKQQQMLKEQERQRVLAERIIPCPDLDSLGDGELKSTAQDFVERIRQLESDKYDLSYRVRQKDFEINELTIAVNDLRGKFVKPTLKKVSKTDSQFDKLKKKQKEQVDFRNNLKQVEKKQFTLDEEKKEETKVEWSK
ncbi:troponin I 4 [Aphelenchoides avenae]|nr:troponin I 4 [Aphelenchus avenae]